MFLASESVEHKKHALHGCQVTRNSLPNERVINGDLRQHRPKYLVQPHFQTSLTCLSSNALPTAYKEKEYKSQVTDL